ncbi:MAG TPA: alpha-galactosidase, partial [Candidatus Saccharimonadales bacterium]|nr:alpha-galactosidase [Candidatus Saccharimonadales bacterium]
MSAGGWKALWLSFMITGLLSCQSAHAMPVLHGPNLQVTVASDGAYSISTEGNGKPMLKAEIAAKINHQWVQSSDYPDHQVALTRFRDSLGAGPLAKVSFTGLSSEPDLSYTIRLYDRLPFGDIEVNVANNTGKSVTVQELRLTKAIGDDKLDLGGQQNADRVLSDSYSEDDPKLRIRDLGDAPGDLHRAVGLQLIYNRQSRESLLLAALTSQRFLTMIHLQTEKTPGNGFQIATLTVDSTGTSEALRAGPLHGAPAQDLLELSLALPPGKSLPSERVMFAAGKDYHRQLEEYGKAIRLLHHARVDSTAPMGWWSWTACYRNINQDTALENARWLADHLKNMGFTYFHIDAGYAYALGECTTPDRSKFPKGMSWMGKQVAALGLRLGIWTAPFEVSERSQIYQKHRDWLVRNRLDQPLQIDGFWPGQDRTYVLDTT